MTSTPASWKPMSCAGDIAAVKGAQEKPHCPITSSVTPWQTWLSARPSTGSTKSEWVWMSMKPGATVIPDASSMSRAASGGMCSAIAATRQPAMPRSPRKAGAPVPSRMSPPRTARSNKSARPSQHRRAAASSSPITAATAAQSSSRSASGMRMSHSRSSTASVAGGVCGSARKRHCAETLV